MGIVRAWGEENIFRRQKTAVIFIFIPLDIQFLSSPNHFVYHDLSHSFLLDILVIKSQKA